MSKVEQSTNRLTIVDAMATQSIASCSVFEAQLFVRGYHDYMHLWTPRAGKVLMLQREPQNTVAVIKNNLVVGHVLYLTIWLCCFSTFWGGSVTKARHGRSYWGQSKPWRWSRIRNTMEVSPVWPWGLHRESEDPRSSRLKVTSSIGVSAITVII